MKTNVLRSFETAEFTHPTTRRHSPEHPNPQFHRGKKPRICLITGFPTPSVCAVRSEYFWKYSSVSVPII